MPNKIKTGTTICAMVYKVTSPHFHLTQQGWSNFSSRYKSHKWSNGRRQKLWEDSLACPQHNVLWCRNSCWLWVYNK